MIMEQTSLDVSLDSEKDYDNNIYYFIFSALLGRCSIYEKIKLNDGGEQRQLVDNIFKLSSNFVDCSVFCVDCGVSNKT